MWLYERHITDIPRSLNIALFVFIIFAICLYVFMCWFLLGLSAKKLTKRVYNPNAVNFAVWISYITLTKLSYRVNITCLIRYCDAKKHTDDTALSMVNTDLKVLISSVKVKIQKLFKWCSCNKLTINIDITYFVLFHTVNKPVPDGFTEIATTHMTIKRATEMKYLGLVLDGKLNYNEHVQSICNSLLKYFGIFNHIKHKVNKKTARQLYFAFVFSIIKCGIEIYSNCSDRNVNKIQIMQNKLLIYFCN